MNLILQNSNEILFTILFQNTRNINDDAANVIWMMMIWSTETILMA